MSKFDFIETFIKGLYVVKPKIYIDERGYFMEVYNEKEFQNVGLDMKFVQDNQSYSKKGVLRGMHMQLKYPQGKLVRVSKGEVFDVCVDLRENSETYGKWFGEYLSGENKKMIYIPEGFAHGFLTISENAEFIYKCSNFYYQEFEWGFVFDDENVGIDWPKLDNIILTEKDKKMPKLKNAK